MYRIIVTSYRPEMGSCTLTIQEKRPQQSDKDNAMAAPEFEIGFRPDGERQAANGGRGEWRCRTIGNAAISFGGRSRRAYGAALARFVLQGIVLMCIL